MDSQNKLETAKPAWLARCENPRKRRNLTRWRVNRLRRLEYEIKTGRATERQRLRALHLQLTGLFCQKNRGLFLTQLATWKAVQSIDKRLRSRIYGSGRGSVFTPDRFLDLGGRAAIDKALSRLAAAGVLQRLGRGLYHYPKQHPQLGTLAPTVEAIANALAGKQGGRLQPAGAYAANLLGLSTQVAVAPHTHFRIRPTPSHTVPCARFHSRGATYHAPASESCSPRNEFHPWSRAIAVYSLVNLDKKGCGRHCP